MQGQQLGNYRVWAVLQKQSNITKAHYNRTLNSGSLYSSNENKERKIK
jgi:hypothetical protein